MEHYCSVFKRSAISREPWDANAMLIGGTMLIVGKKRKIV